MNIVRCWSLLCACVWGVGGVWGLLDLWMRVSERHWWLDALACQRRFLLTHSRGNWYNPPKKHPNRDGALPFLSSLKLLISFLNFPFYQTLQKAKKKKKAKKRKLYVALDKRPSYVWVWRCGRIINRQPSMSGPLWNSQSEVGIFSTYGTVQIYQYMHVAMLRFFVEGSFGHKILTVHSRLFE